MKRGVLSDSFYETKITMVPKPDKDITKMLWYRPRSFMNINLKTFTKCKQIESSNRQKDYIMVMCT